METEDDGSGTPGPTRVRIHNLEKQVQELVRKYQSEQRKVEAETKEGQRRAEEWEDERALLRHQLAVEAERTAHAKEEAERVTARDQILRDELSLLSDVEAKKAALAAADDDLAALEAEFVAARSKSESLVWDHKLSLSESRAADLTALSEEKESRIAELEAQLATANTSLAHQRAAANQAAISGATHGEEVSALQKSLEETQGQLDELKAKHESLKAEHKALVKKEAAARSQVDSLEKEAKETSAKLNDEEVGELRAQLRAAKSEAAKAEKAVEAAQEEAEETKSEYKELLRTLKEKYRTAKAEAVRLAGVEEELEALKSVAVPGRAPAAAPAKKGPKKKAEKTESPKKPKKDAKAPSPSPSPKVQRVRKTSPLVDEEEDEPRKKARNTKSKPLAEADGNAAVDADEEETPLKPKKKKVAVVEDEPVKPRQVKKDILKDDSEDEAPAPAPKAAAKKKKRILGGAAPAFQWDPILNSGDGVIPSFLSPVSGKSAGGTIPRAGFGALSARTTRF